MLDNTQISDNVITVHPLDQVGFDHIKEGYEGVPDENKLADKHNTNVANNTVDKDNVAWPNSNASRISSMAEGYRAFENLGVEVAHGDQSN